MVEDREEMPQRLWGKEPEDEERASAYRDNRPEPRCASHVCGRCACEDDGETAANPPESF